ncbi:alginate O-acetyltransferase complex protein AlgJ [Clostridium neonatale]|uniref:alginate O-acetyltransferase AlgX-related protein n=1 Tax=Clostridium neonatale TaxID=137838 RepID=UPI00291B6936|nr:alginate O-acetyltransferase complex protein AlgJ [Clostridium neonatale]
MNKLKKMKIIFILCFIIMISIPMMCVNRIQGKVSETEKRTLAQFPNFINEGDGKFNHNFPQEFNSWINDNIGFREFFGKINAKINYNLMESSPSNSVHIGKDGWLFYTNDNNIEIASGEYLLDEKILLEIKNEQEAIQKALAKKGIEYVLVLTPSKASIYPEEIKGANFKVRETPIDVVEKYLKENTTIKVINTKDELLKAKDNGIQVYNKTDTHWNEEGAYIGYKNVINELNNWGIINTKVADINQVPYTYKGEFSAMMGDISLIDSENIMATEIINPKATEVENNDLLNLLERVQINDNFGYGGNRFYNNGSIKNKNILMYGDSFFGKWKIPELFAENASNFNYVLSDSIKGEVIDKVKPDVVIFERTERYITTLAKKADPLMVYGKLKNPSAEIISDTTPEKVIKGEKYNINITVKNTTNQIWRKERNIRLCIFQNGYDYGYRIDIPEGIEIKPEEEHTFTLYGFQAPNSKSTYLEYQMVEEGITYFGEKQKKDIIIEW